MRLIGVEAAGRGLDGEDHGATLLRGTPGILHGAETYVLQDGDGQIADSWSVSAGLDYPAVGPEHSYLKESGRADYVGATDAEALAAFTALADREGILCAFESAHAVAHALKLAEAEPDSVILVGLSGRGDKDVAQARALLRMSRYAAMFERLAERARARSALSSCSATRTSKRAPSCSTRWSRRAPTWSRSAFPSPIRSPTAR